MIGGDTIKKYEKEILQSQLNDEKAVLKQLEQNYQQAIRDIDEKVAALLGRADADAAHVVFQVEYQRQLRTQVQSILEQLQANEFETISEYLTQCYEEGFMGSLYSMQQQGVPLAFPINQEQIVMALQTDSKISEGLYTRLGKDIGELKKNISAEIARGISTSLPYAQIAKNLDRQAQIGLNRAMRITRTEGGRIQNKAAMDTMTKAKAMGADVVKRWSAALDARTRDSHAKIDGEVKEIEEKFSNGLMYPKDPSGKASEVVNCRCKVQEKARWALTANQTKMLGNTKNMTDEQKEAIAKRLGVPVEDLDQYSGQIVPINAKNYADFKKQYKGIWNYEGSDLQKEANARIANYKKPSKKLKEEWASADAELKEKFGLDSRDKLTDIAKRGTMKLKQGIACFPDGDVLNKNIQNVEPKEGFFDVAMHGSPTAVAFGSKKPNMSPRLLASVIRHSDGYDGQNIRLLACSTGKVEDDEYCFAEELANALGVQVEAPTDTLYVGGDGSIKIGFFGTGEFKPFTPNERGRRK